MKFDINDLSSKLTKVESLSKEIDTQEKINKYGTFLDSKKDIIQLYVLFIFFGIHEDIIQQLPELHEYPID
jgi:hypothetical protein